MAAVEEDNRANRCSTEDNAGDEDEGVGKNGGDGGEEGGEEGRRRSFAVFLRVGGTVVLDSLAPLKDFGEENARKLELGRI